MDVRGITRERYKHPNVEQFIPKTSIDSLKKVLTSSELMVKLIRECDVLTSTKRQSAMKETEIDTHA
jgi:hypothetical protein